MAPTKQKPKREPLAALRKKSTALRNRIRDLETGWYGKEKSVQQYENQVNEILLFLSQEFKASVGINPPPSVQKLARQRIRKLREKKLAVQATVKVLRGELEKVEKQVEEGRTGLHKCSECGIMHSGLKPADA